MKITIAVDDISLPLAPDGDARHPPDGARGRSRAALGDHGIDDIHIIVANSLHRKMTEREMRRMVGTEIHDAFYPDRYYCHDAEDPDGLVSLGETRHGETLRINRRACESDLVIYININLVPMDGGHKSVTVGLCDYSSLTHHHEPQTIIDSNGYMDPARSELNHKCVRMGALVDEHLNVFHIETVLNNRMYTDQLEFLGKNEDDFTELDRMKLKATTWTTSKLPRADEAGLLSQHPVPVRDDRLLRGNAPSRSTRRRSSAASSSTPSRSRVSATSSIVGVPYISPYNVNSILNPLLVQVMGPGYFFNLYRGKPLVREGRRAHSLPPVLRRVRRRTSIRATSSSSTGCCPRRDDAFDLREKYEEEFANNPSYIQMYRQGNAYHGAHPFFMWYWGENGRRHVSKIIAAGAENQHVPELLGWDRAETLAEAIANARSHLGRSAEITMLHLPPIRHSPR